MRSYLGKKDLKTRTWYARMRMRPSSYIQILTALVVDQCYGQLSLLCYVTIVNFGVTLSVSVFLTIVITNLWIILVAFPGYATNVVLLILIVPCLAQCQSICPILFSSPSDLNDDDPNDCLSVTHPLPSTPTDTSDQHFRKFTPPKNRKHKVKTMMINCNGLKRVLNKLHLEL